MLNRNLSHLSEKLFSAVISLELEVSTGRYRLDWLIGQALGHIKTDAHQSLTLESLQARKFTLSVYEINQISNVDEIVFENCFIKDTKLVIQSNHFFGECNGTDRCYEKTLFSFFSKPIGNIFSLLH